MTDQNSIKTGIVEVKVRGFFRSAWRKRLMTLNQKEMTLAIPDRTSGAGRITQSFILKSLKVSPGSTPTELTVLPTSTADAAPLHVRCQGEAEAQSWMHGFTRAGMADFQKPTDLTAQRSLSVRISSVRLSTAAVATAGGGSVIEPDTSLVSYDRNSDKADIMVLDGGSKVKCSIYSSEGTAATAPATAARGQGEQHKWPLASMMVNGGITFGETQNMGMFALPKPPPAAVAGTLDERFVNGGVTAGGYSLNMGVFKLPETRSSLKERRVTMGSSQALLLLFRDARIMRERNQLPEAEHLMQQHLALVQMVFGAESDKAVRSMQLLADIVSSRGHFADAQQLLEEAAEIENKLIA